MRSFELQLEGEVFGRGVRAPFLWLRVGRRGAWTEPIRGFVDTGSPVSLIESSVLSSLGVPIAGAADRVTYGGETHEIVRVELDLALLASPLDQADANALVLPSSVFGVWNETAAPAVLLGQHDLLERFQLLHRNYDPFVDFVLRRA